MGCSGCSSSGSCGTSGSSGGGSACGTCHSKLPVFNWLSEVHDPKQDIVEVTFKNGRKGFYRNHDKLQLKAADIVTVEGNPGYDIGIVSMAGAMIRLQMRKKGVDKDDESIKKIYRKSNQQDLDKWQIARAREKETMYRTRIMASEIGLHMKITDVEFQGDNGKATFYYTAEERVDFRELIKVMAQEFKIRIEMRQIGARQESARLGGIGSCGRELCCSTWLTDFRSVNTSAARYQQLSLNPQKLAGQCGKLKCCLNYELESYIDAIKDFPPQTALKLKQGRAQFQKMDIFGGKILYSVQEEFKISWIELTLDKVKEVQDLNANGVYPESLEEYEIQKEEDLKIEFENVVGQDSLTRFDASGGRRGRKPKSKSAKIESSNPSSPSKSSRNGNKGQNGAQNKSANPEKNQGKSTAAEREKRRQAINAKRKKTNHQDSNKAKAKPSQRGDQLDDSKPKKQTRSSRPPRNKNGNQESERELRKPINSTEEGKEVKARPSRDNRNRGNRKRRPNSTNEGGSKSTNEQRAGTNAQQKGQDNSKPNAPHSGNRRRQNPRKKPNQNKESQNDNDQ